MTTVPSNDGIDDPEHEPVRVYARPMSGETNEEFAQRFLELIFGTAEETPVEG